MLLLVLLSSLLLVSHSMAKPCEVYLPDGTCAWSFFRIEKGITFKQAEKICRKSGDTVAQISDEESYEKVAEHLRSKIPDYLDSTRTWIGLEVNPLTGETTKPGPEAFTMWDPMEGIAVGAQYDDWTNVYLQIDADPDMEAQGMINYRPDRKMDGVICQKAA